MAASKKPTPKTKSTKNTAKTKPSRKKTQALESFKPCPDNDTFLTFSLTRQTVYWLVLSGVVLILGLWIVKLQNDISYIYDQIETSNALSAQAEAELQAKKQQMED